MHLVNNWLGAFLIYNVVKVRRNYGYILSIVLIPQIVSLIVEKDKLDEIIALNEFYQSKVYDLLAIEDTKMWHYSALTLYMMWKHEKKTNELLFPEEL